MIEIVMEGKHSKVVLPRDNEGLINEQLVMQYVMFYDWCTVDPNWDHSLKGSEQKETGSVYVGFNDINDLSFGDFINRYKGVFKEKRLTVMMVQLADMTLTKSLMYDMRGTEFWMDEFKEADQLGNKVLYDCFWSEGHLCEGSAYQMAEQVTGVLENGGWGD